MGVRTLIVLAILTVVIPAALKYPWIGALGWTWIGLMNPHRMTFDFLFTAPVGAAMAGATLIGLAFTKERRMPPVNAVTLTLAALLLWFCVTTLLAVHRDLVGPMFEKVMKVQFMIFVSLALLYTQRHLQAFVWVVALSLAFFGVKGGVFSIATLGEGRVWGPPGGFIEGNNEVGLALIMTIPLLHYLRGTVADRWVRHGLLLAILLCALSVLGTHSRGAFLAIAAMAIWLWWKSDSKLPFGIALIAVAVAFLAFMPESWEQRMRSIGSYEEDDSAMGRINAWAMAFNLASDRLTGAGFETATPQLFQRYAPDPSHPRAAHSIYFQVLGEHGFIGLGLFLMLWLFTWRAAGWIMRHAPAVGLPQLGRLAAAVQVSFIGYFVGGAFLSLAYFDLPYDMMMMVLIARALVEERVRQRDASASHLSSPTTRPGNASLAEQ